MGGDLTLTRLFARGRLLGRGKTVCCHGTGGAVVEIPHEEFTDGIIALANALRGAGLQPGDRVATLAGNHIRHLQVMWAAPLAGGVFHGINPRLPAEDIAYILADAGDRLLLLDDDQAAVYARISGHLPHPPQVWKFGCGGADDRGYLSVEERLAKTPGDGAPAELEIEEAAPAVLCYTSGTTGRPKGVAYTHRALSLHVFNEAMVDGYGMHRGDRVLLLVPFCHGAAWGIPFSALMCGASMDILEGTIKAERLLAILINRKITFSAAVPEVFSRLADALKHLPRRRGALAGLRLLMGGAAAPGPMLRRLIEAGVHCIHCWGMTETLSAASLHHLTSEADAEDPHQGTALPLFELRIAPGPGAGSWAHPGESAGELQVRGPCVVRQYHGGKRGVGADGWFSTGDIAEICADGVLHIRDRKKDLIKSGGEWISPARLERAIKTVQDVTDCVIIGAPHAEWGERPLALVVLREGGALDPAGIDAALSATVARWQMPDELVVVPKFPRTPLGKIDRMRLRREYSRRFAASPTRCP